MPVKDPQRRRFLARERQRRYRARHHERVLLRNREALRSTRIADPQSFRQYAKNWEAKNGELRAAIEARRKIAYARDPQRRAHKVEYATQWAKANPARKRATEAKWRSENPERLTEITRAANKRYRERHPHVVQAIDTQRKRAKQATPLWGDKDLIRVVYKKSRALGFEVDHVVPLKHPLVCGLHVWHNLQALDRNLNRAKNNRAWPDMP